jgi:NitT/TauT family transport system ATP-binding protein
MGVADGTIQDAWSERSHLLDFCNTAAITSLTMDTYLNLHAISKTFDDLLVIQELSLQVQPGEILSLVGPSGCGKSTLLRIIADLETIEQGEIHRQVMPHQIGFIFQDVRLLPWRSALQNVLFVLKDRIPDTQLRETRAQNVLQQVGLAEFVHFPPANLSGGMRKRVAIARALAIDPDLLLFDEPFSDLDLPLRMTLLVDIQRLLHAGQKTAIYVTHDVREALLISDRIVVLTARPARIKADIPLSHLPRRRDKFVPELDAIEKQVLAMLQEEMRTTESPSNPTPRQGAQRNSWHSLLEMAAWTADCMREEMKMRYMDNNNSF